MRHGLDVLAVSMTGGAARGLAGSGPRPGACREARALGRAAARGGAVRHGGEA